MPKIECVAGYGIIVVNLDREYFSLDCLKEKYPRFKFASSDRAVFIYHYELTKASVDTDDYDEKPWAVIEAHETELIEIGFQKKFEALTAEIKEMKLIKKGNFKFKKPEVYVFLSVTEN